MIENLVFFNPQTSLSEINKLDCKKETNLSDENSQTSLSENDNNKEYIINNLNKELNHKEHKSYEHEFANDDLKKIKQWFMTNKIDFSKKHEAKVLELLKNNSLGFILKTFQDQLDILKNKSDVKNIAAVFSNHLFKGTTEVNTKEIEMREAEQEKIKNENEIIEEMKNPMLRDIKRNAESVFYLMISQKIKEKIGVLWKKV